MGKAIDKSGKKEIQGKRHVIDLLLPIALFLVLAAASLLVVLLAADVYKRSVAQEEANYQGRTCLSYVTEKIRQGDENGGVSAGDLNGVPCLMFCQTYGGNSYVTYLYSYEGELRELLVQEGVEMSAADGQRILEVEDFQVTETEKGIFRISCSDGEGGELFTYAALKSRA